MKIQTAIFDLDGTLLDTLGDLCDSVNCAMLRHGFPAVSEEQTRVRVGNGVRNLIRQCIPEDKCTEQMLDICLDEFRTAYNQRMMNRTSRMTASYRCSRRSNGRMFRSVCCPTSTTWPPRA